MEVTLAVAIQALGVIVGVVFTVGMVAGLASSLFYRPASGEERADHVRLVITSIASDNVSDALYEVIDHTTRKFPEYELYCVVDEGSDLEDELVAMDAVETVVVPSDYACEAVAKGRAINYFIETVVAAAPDYWYGFIDDDNLILDDQFLYEIPEYEARGYGAMNPVLFPRQGRSKLTFVADHIRYIDDIAIYRLFTGILGRPYLGLHGELLCARGDVLTEITFDRDTIVEDFAFALELVEADVRVWQSRTRVSVLSPHDLRSFFAQRARWYLGIARYLPHAPIETKIVAGARITTWSFGVTSSWLLFPLWVLGYGLNLPFWLGGLLVVGSLIYACTITYGAARVGGVRALLLVPLIPVYAMMEHVVPLYALATRRKDFVVIDK